MSSSDNPLGTDGFEFLEFATPHTEQLKKEFEQLGFEQVASRTTAAATVFAQGELHFIINEDPASHAVNFSKAHGPCVSAMGFRVQDKHKAFELALARGAKAYEGEDGAKVLNEPAIYGIGGALIYFIDHADNQPVYQGAFDNYTQPRSKRGLKVLDHVTHNVPQGRMDYWADFYKTIFNFEQVRYFDIKGLYTGLISRALASPCGKIRIPINEPTDDQSQIAEYLREYNGEGIQHIAMTSENIYDSVESLRADGVKFLTVPDSYYDMLPERLPEHDEDVPRMHKDQILMDGGEAQGGGLLLQIFTENMIGPVFFEIIQRKGNEGFGEGNFQALFDAMERDQIRRGTLKIDE